MLSKLQKIRDHKTSDQKGFTIIEVMIVLAIAGLIIVIVLLAVPALQRNGRNTGIRSDANQLAGYASTFSTDNQGAIPTKAGSVVTAGVVTINNASGTASMGKIQAGTKTTFVDAASPAAKVTPLIGELTVVYGARCPDSVTGVDVTPVNSARSISVIYATETSGGTAAQCIGS